MAYKNPQQLINSITPKVNQDTLDNDIRNMFSNRPEGLEYIYDSYEGDERKNALSRLDKVYPEKRDLRQRWDDYINYGLPYGSERYPELWNDEIAEIEKQLAFKDQAEHDKWLDQGMAWKGEPEWLDLTDAILTRSGYPKKQQKAIKQSKLPF